MGCVSQRASLPNENWNLPCHFVGALPARFAVESKHRLEVVPVRLLEGLVDPVDAHALDGVVDDGDQARPDRLQVECAAMQLERGWSELGVGRPLLGGVEAAHPLPIFDVEECNEFPVLVDLGGDESPNDAQHVEVVRVS